MKLPSVVRGSMATMYCGLCNRPVEARRHVGIGTVVAAFLTAGLSLIAVPFYPKRCSICHSTALSPTRPDGSPVGGAALQSARVTELQQRLTRAVDELESTNAELDRVRTERDFYRQLLGDPARRKEPPGG